MVTTLLGTTCLAFACSGSDSTPTKAEFESRQYTVRGVVKDVSQLSADPQRLRIHHEAIDDLVGADGSPEPMRAMAMSLVVGTDVSMPPDLAPEDKVQFVLDVAWERTPVGIIAAVEPLDPTVELVLE